MLKESLSEIRGLMIQVTQGRVLLPNACVSEIITAPTPEPMPQAPAWVLGLVRWRGWKLPLFSFSKLIHLTEAETSLTAKVIVIKAHMDQKNMPYVGMLCLGFPRLTTIATDGLIALRDEERFAQGVGLHVLYKDEEAFIPDLDHVEQQLLAIKSP